MLIKIFSVYNDDSLHSIYNVCDKKDITWKKEAMRTNVKFRPFTKTDIQNVKQPGSLLSYFQDYISDGFIETVTNMTNLYNLKSNLQHHKKEKHILV